jgi:hypothetical protein
MFLSTGLGPGEHKALTGSGPWHVAKLELPDKEDFTFVLAATFGCLLLLLVSVNRALAAIACRCRITSDLESGGKSDACKRADLAVQVWSGLAVMTVGLSFGTGLVVSGMCDQAKVGHRS